MVPSATSFNQERAGDEKRIDVPPIVQFCEATDMSLESFTEDLDFS
jgi:hypothetical protein